MARRIDITGMCDTTVSIIDAGRTVGADGGLTINETVVASGLEASVQVLGGGRDVLYGQSTAVCTHEAYLPSVPTFDSGITLHSGMLVEDENTDLVYEILAYNTWNSVNGGYFHLLLRLYT